MLQNNFEIFTDFVEPDCGTIPYQSSIVSLKASASSVNIMTDKQKPESEY